MTSGSWHFSASPIYKPAVLFKVLVYALALFWFPVCFLDHCLNWPSISMTQHIATQQNIDCFQGQKVHYAISVMTQTM